MDADKTYLLEQILALAVRLDTLEALEKPEGPSPVQMFHDMGKRLDALEKQVAELLRRVGALEKRAMHLKVSQADFKCLCMAQFDTLKQRVADLEAVRKGGDDALANRLNTLAERLTELEKSRIVGPGTPPVTIPTASSEWVHGQKAKWDYGLWTEAKMNRETEEL